MALARNAARRTSLTSNKQGQRMTQQLRRLPRPALERAAEVGGIMKAEVGGHGIVVVAMRLEQINRLVCAYLVQLGLEMRAMTRQVAFQGGGTDAEFLRRAFQRG